MHHRTILRSIAPLAAAILLGGCLADDEHEEPLVGDVAKDVERAREVGRPSWESCEEAGCDEAPPGPAYSLDEALGETSGFGPVSAPGFTTTTWRDRCEATYLLANEACNKIRGRKRRQACRIAAMGALAACMKIC